MEAQKNNNHSFDMSEIIKPYHLIIENINNTPKQALLLGEKYYLKEVNFGSEIGVWIKPADHDVTYLQLLQQSVIEFKTKGIRILSKSWEKMPRRIFYKNIKTGETDTISLVNPETWGVKIINDRAVNDVEISKLINENTYFILVSEPLSEIELLIY